MIRHRPPFAWSFAVALAVACASLGSGPARAGDVQLASVHGTDVDLPIPEGHCRLIRDNEADGTVIALTEKVNEGRNTLLLMFADCAELEAFRTKGTELTNYGSYLTPTSARTPVRMPRARFAKLIGEQFEKQQALIERAQEEARQRVRSTGVAEIQQNRNLGLLHRDDTGAYTGVLQSWQVEGGGTFQLAVVAAITLVRDRVVSINLASANREETTVASLLRDQRDLVKQLIAAN